MGGSYIWSDPLQCHRTCNTKSNGSGYHCLSGSLLFVVGLRWTLCGIDSQSSISASSPVLTCVISIILSANLALTTCLLPVYRWFTWKSCWVRCDFGQSVLPGDMSIGAAANDIKLSGHWLNHFPQALFWVCKVGFPNQDFHNQWITWHHNLVKW